MRDEVVAARYHDRHNKDWKKTVIYFKMCSILCVSSLWHSEEDAFVNIVTEKIAKYLIWTPCRVHDLPSRSEGGMISTGPYLTSFLQGWHVLLSSAKKWGKWILWSFKGGDSACRNPTSPKLQGRTLVNIDTPGEDIISFLSLGDGRERHKSWRIWETLRKKSRRLRKEMETWTLEDLRSALGKKKKSHLKSTRRSYTLNPESYTTLRTGTIILIQKHWVSFSTYWND